MNRSKRLRRILIYLLITVLSLCALYFSIGLFPSFSEEMAMHRAEARELVGPSRVIAGDDVAYSGVDRILIGETDFGYTLYEYQETSWDSGCLSYHEKARGLTCFTTAGYFDPYFDEVLPVYAIPEDGSAVRARLTLETASTVQEEYNAVLTAEAELQEDTFFLFEVDTADVYEQILYFWYYRIQGRQDGHGYTTGTLTVELFNSDGDLLDTVTQEFPSRLR